MPIASTAKAMETLTLTLAITLTLTLTSTAKAMEDAVNIAAQPPLPGAAAHSSLVSGRVRGRGRGRGRARARVGGRGRGRVRVCEVHRVSIPWRGPSRRRESAAAIGARA